MDGMKWMASMTPRDNTGFKIIVLQDLHQYVRKAQIYNNIYNRSQGAYSQSFRRARFTTIFTIFIQILCSVFHLSFFIYNIHRDSGLTFIATLQILFLFLKTICQQRELPLLYVAAAVKLVLFFYFVLRRGNVTGVTFIVGHRIEVSRVGG